MKTKYSVGIRMRVKGYVQVSAKDEDEAMEKAVEKANRDLAWFVENADHVDTDVADCEEIRNANACSTDST